MRQEALACLIGVRQVLWQASRQCPCDFKAEKFAANCRSLLFTLDPEPLALYQLRPRRIPEYPALGVIRK